MSWPLAFEFHGGNAFTVERHELHAGDLVIRLASVWEELDRLASDEEPVS